MSLEWVICCLKYLFIPRGKAGHLQLQKLGSFMTRTHDVWTGQNIAHKHDSLRQLAR